MTSERERMLQGVVENLWFKLISRASMIVLAALVTAGAPVVWSIAQRSYDAFGQLRDVQIKQQAQIERQEFSQAVDRSAFSDRLTILSNRLSEFSHDYARIDGVVAGWTLRDQRVDAINHRVEALETRGLK